MLRDSAASAVSPAWSERSGCQIVHAANSAPATSAPATARRTPQRIPGTRPPRGSARGPRPATYPAATSATTAVPGTNHVQSTSECTPNASTPAISVRIAIRSGVNGRPRNPGARGAAAVAGGGRRRIAFASAEGTRGRAPPARAAASIHTTSANSEAAAPASPSSARSWTA